MEGHLIGLATLTGELRVGFNPPRPSANSIVTFLGLHPSPRADGNAWVEARIDGTDAIDGQSGWGEIEVIELASVDEDPSYPSHRDLTVKAPTRWLRVVFLDEEEGEDTPSPRMATVGLPFRPAVEEVAAILRARTYSGADGDLAGGVLLGDFTDSTRPTFEEVEHDLIPQACTDVARAVGGVPALMLEEARRVAVLRTASEIERSYIPEQAEEQRTVYQTLRMTYEETQKILGINIWYWTQANRGGLL